MEKLLIFLVIAIVAIAIVQIVRVYELASKVKGDKVEETITKGENTLNGNLFILFMIAFFGSIIWMMVVYGDGGMGEAASEHGLEIDSLLMLNWWIILPVFFITNALLFVFVRMYLYDPNRRSLYFAHSNKLEMIWTVFPSMALAVIIIFGLKTWNSVMNPEDKGTVIEVYGQQFGWTARYSGEDNKLGRADYKLITNDNPLGVVTEKNIEGSYAYLDKKIAGVEEKLAKNKVGNEYLLPDAKVKELTDKLESLKRQKYRIKGGIDKDLEASVFNMANNDILTKELHLIKGETYTFQFRSKDIIHSAWFPHFRAQMNCVPGMITNFTFKPNKTTAEVRADDFTIEHYKDINEAHNERKRAIGEAEEEVEFDFVLMCNKICGASHYNMQMKVIVETEEEFKSWIESQKQIDGNAPKYWGTQSVAEKK
jgi:cytochrome c oxidase subunit 2